MDKIIDRRRIVSQDCKGPDEFEIIEIIRKNRTRNVSSAKGLSIKLTLRDAGL